MKNRLLQFFLLALPFLLAMQITKAQSHNETVQSLLMKTQQETEEALNAQRKLLDALQAAGIQAPEELSKLGDDGYEKLENLQTILLNLLKSISETPVTTVKERAEVAQRELENFLGFIRKKTEQAEQLSQETATEEEITTEEILPETEEVVEIAPEAAEPEEDVVSLTEEEPAAEEMELEPEVAPLEEIIATEETIAPEEGTNPTVETSEQGDIITDEAETPEATPEDIPEEMVIDIPEPDTESAEDMTLPSEEEPSDIDIETTEEDITIPEEGKTDIETMDDDTAQTMEIDFEEAAPSMDIDETENYEDEEE